ncbi:MAG: hypothetical protein E7361_00120 [Clostridiales bacterium]|nr:hypothetical protein [Clostridiales bacterium]
MKNNRKIVRKSNLHLKKNKKYAQQSMDFFAQNTINSLPIISPHIISHYNKYLLTKHRDKLLRIKNFLNFKISEKDDLVKAFEKLNYIRLKIMILERDVNAYRTALMLSYNAKDKNIILQKRIRYKYAKLRKYDTYQNLSLGIIYNKCILEDKIKAYKNNANAIKDRIIAKHDSAAVLQAMQKDFIFSIIAKRQSIDGVFKDNVSISTLQSLLKHNPEYRHSLHNITTFTNHYLHRNPGSLSKDFVAFKANHTNSKINTIVKDYLSLYSSKHPGTTNEELNNIQNELFTSFSYKDFKNSDIFGAMDRALSVNDILLKAKTNFTKLEICSELKYCLDMPEINNYFKIIEAKDRIKNYIISNERIFVERIEKEFPEIKSSSFIYMYNKVKSTLNTYMEEVLQTEQYLVRDLINCIMTYEITDDVDKSKVLNNIALGIYEHPESIQAKQTLDLYAKLMTQFEYLKASNNVEFEEKLENSKLFHGVLVSKSLQPILPIQVQSRIIKLPYNAQVNLARNYNNSTILNTLDEFTVTPLGELKLGDKIVSFGYNSSSSIARLSMLMVMNKLEDYRYILDGNKSMRNERNLAGYIIAGVREDLENSAISTIQPNKTVYHERVDTEEVEDTEETPVEPEINNKLTNQIEDTTDPIDEVVDYNKIRKYISSMSKDEDKGQNSKKILAIQKRINSGSLRLQSVQIDNLNELLNEYGLALRTPYDYVIHLIEKYTADKRDLNSLQVGLKLRIRMGNLILSDEEIDNINNDHNMNLNQRIQPRIKKQKSRLLQIYKLTGEKSDNTKEKLEHSDALVRNTLKKKSNKLVSLDMKLYRILNT